MILSSVTVAAILLANTQFTAASQQQPSEGWLTQSNRRISQERPSNITRCDYYTEKTVGANTAANQQILMALVLHSALLGPFSTYNTVKVAGFSGCLVPTTFDGDYVDLNGYFNGGFASSNTGSDHGVPVNFLDNGGLDAARQLKPGLGNTTSHQ
jgi:hypothetical protein